MNQIVGMIAPADAPTPDVILVEDDEDIRETLRMAIEMEGFAVAAYPNGKEAMDALLSLRPGEYPKLILLDLMMPVMNGWEFLEVRNRNGGAVATIPVVVVSAASDVSFPKTGARGFIKKPIDLDVMIRLVKSYCARPAVQAS